MSLTIYIKPNDFVLIDDIFYRAYELNSVLYEKLHISQESSLSMSIDSICDYISRGCPNFHPYLEHDLMTLNVNIVRSEHM